MVKTRRGSTSAAHGTQRHTAAHSGTQRHTAAHSTQRHGHGSLARLGTRLRTRLGPGLLERPGSLQAPAEFFSRGILDPSHGSGEHMGTPQPSLGTSTHLLEGRAPGFF